MQARRKIAFVTATRADYGKLKSLMRVVHDAGEFELHLFVTGMHLLSRYGLTVGEVEKAGYGALYRFINQSPNDAMDSVLAKTVSGLGDYVKEMRPDLIVVHGDRVEALAGAIVGALNNVLVAHVEGGELSGTVDELIRHSVSKLAHIHFVANDVAHKRLVQLGERRDSIYTIGSPDIDIMFSDSLPDLSTAKEYYEITFDRFAILMFHPVTTDLERLPSQISALVSAALESGENYVVVYPNNDHGSGIIFDELERLAENQRFRIFPSIRFEYFLSLLKNAAFMIGNSSAGVREAPCYGVPSINIGDRQINRAQAPSIYNCHAVKDEIIAAILQASDADHLPSQEFGAGDSDLRFLAALNSEALWRTNRQKMFVDAD